MSEPTTKEQAVSRLLSRLATITETDIQAILTQRGVELDGDVRRGEWDGTYNLNRLSELVSGMRYDSGFCAGVALSLRYLAPYLDIPPGLIERAARGDELAATDYTRFTRGE